MAPSVQQIDRPSSEAVYSSNNNNTSSSSRSANGKSPAGSVKGKTYTSKECIELEHHYGAHNYHPLPVVFDKASGSNVWDPEGKEYIDMLSAYSAVNQGHCHPKIVNALITQAQRLTLSSRAFHSSPLGPYTEKVTSLLGFDMLLPMNTGVEAVETAIKLSRKWAYEVKGVPEGKAIVLSAENNFHGRTIGVISMSTDPESRKGFGPFLKGVGPICPFEPKEGEEQRRIRYNNIGDLERVLEKHGKEVAAFLVEPIQGEAGIVVPAEDYLEKAQELCRKHRVLLICDEIQTGLGRTGKMMCFQHNPNVKPDIVTLGKALSGGVYPVSAVLASKEIMMCIRPGEHGSTYGGNPLGCAVASAALDVLVEEDLANRAERLGKIFRAELEELKNPWIQEVRGKGLLNAIVIDEAKSQKGRGAWQLCLLMKSRGLLAKPTHRNIIRLAPPLVIPEEDLHRAVKIIGECLNDLEEVDVIPGEDDEEKGYHNELDD